MKLKHTHKEARVQLSNALEKITNAVDKK